MIQAELKKRLSVVDNLLCLRAEDEQRLLKAHCRLGDYAGIVNSYLKTQTVVEGGYECDASTLAGDTRVKTVLMF